MSSSLQSEASTLLGSHIFVTAAAQKHYGDRLLLTDVDPNYAAQSAKMSAAILDELKKLRQENGEIKNQIAALRELIQGIAKVGVSGAPAAAASSPSPSAPKEEKKEEKKEEAADDDDFELFGSDDEEDEEKKKIVEERLKAYAEKKSKKPGPIAKSSVILDVKPWDDETNLDEMEAHVRSIEMDGLVWGGAKKIAIGYGISKLQIITVIEDAKVSVDDLQEKIQEFEDHVQSVDIVAFNKI